MRLNTPQEAIKQVRKVKKIYNKLNRNNKKIIRNVKRVQKTFIKPTIPKTYKDEVTQKAKWDPREFDADYHTIPDRALSTATVDRYLKLLLKQGKKVKKLGRVLILPSKFFLMIYNPDVGYQNGEISDENYKKHKNNYLNLNLNQNQRNAKAKMLIKNDKILSYNVVFIPVWIIGHWVLFIINNAEIIYVYDSCYKEYPDAVEAINKYLKQIEKKELPVEYTTEIPGIKDYGNCGTFMLEYVRNELHEGNYEWDNFNIPGINKRIRNELKTGKLVSNYEYKDAGAIAIGPYMPKKPENPKKLKHFERMRKKALYKNQFVEDVKIKKKKPIKQLKMSLSKKNKAIKQINKQSKKLETKKMNNKRLLKKQIIKNKRKKYNNVKAIAK